jgi:hypothetical protein
MGKKEIKQLNDYSTQKGFSILDNSDGAVIKCTRCNLDIARFGLMGDPVEMLEVEMQHREICKPN